MSVIISLHAANINFLQEIRIGDGCQSLLMGQRGQGGNIRVAFQWLTGHRINGHRCSVRNIRQNCIGIGHNGINAKQIPGTLTVDHRRPVIEISFLQLMQQH